MGLHRGKAIFLLSALAFVAIITWFQIVQEQPSSDHRQLRIASKARSSHSAKEELWYLKNLPESDDIFRKIVRIESEIFFAHRMYPLPSYALNIGMPLIPKWFQAALEQFDAMEDILRLAHENQAKSTVPDDGSHVDWNQPQLLRGNDLKIGYYIINHSTEELWRVKKLIRAIFVTDHTIIVIHFDLRIQETPEVAEFRQWLIAEGFVYPYVWVIDAERSLIGRYGMISMIYVELLCLHTLLTSPHGHTIDSFIAMTPADFPIKSKEAILNRLYLYRGHSIYNGGPVYPRSFYFRVENYYVNDFGLDPQKHHPVSLASNNSLLVNLTGKFVMDYHLSDTEKYVVNIGAGWTILSFEWVFYLFAKANRKLLYYWLIHFHNTACVDEFFFQTIFFIAMRPASTSEHLRYYHNELDYTLLNASLYIWDALGYGEKYRKQWRYIQWRGEMSPSVLPEDIPRLMRSSALFARKFDDLKVLKQWTLATHLYSDVKPYTSD